MTAPGRVDQVTVSRTLRDHRDRIRALEALNQTAAGGCPEWQQWSEIGAGGNIAIISNTDCSPDISQPDAGITGSVWACGAIDTIPPPGLIQGSVTVNFTDPGSAGPGDCGDAFFAFYVINPPFVTAAIGAPFDGVPTGFGFTYQESTKTMIPAQLVWDATLGPGWGVMVAGTELVPGQQSFPAGANMARPDYPFPYQSGDTLFTGSFIYNPVLLA